MAINSSVNNLTISSSSNVLNDQLSPLWTSQNLRVSLQAIYEHTFYNVSSTSGGNSDKTIKTIVLTVSYKDTDGQRKSSPLAKSLANASDGRDSQASSSDTDDDENTLAYLFLSSSKKGKPPGSGRATTKSSPNKSGPDGLGTAVVAAAEEFMEFAKFEKTFSDFYNLDVKVKEKRKG